MKVLVIGIDGGTKSILDSMPMPFLQKLFHGAKSRILEEDLITRGWAQILTGESGPMNKSFYLMPLNDGSYDFSASFSKKDMVASSTSKPIWEVLNQAGASVGILNVPTTGPVDEVNGFFVAGGGGGISSGKTIPDGMVYPKKYTRLLEENKYVFDVRLPSGTKTVSEFLEKIRKAQDVQKNTFIDIANRECPDFGFFCFRITTEVQYLARSEIESCIEDIRDAVTKNIEYQPKNSVHKSIVEHYKHIDSSLREIFENLNPEQYMFLGDHSTSVFEFEGNIDVWLKDEGYLFPMNFAQKQLRRAENLARAGARKLMVKMGKQAAVPRIRRPLTKFSRKKSKAFGTFYEIGNFAGIFLNDRHRFGGPIKQGVEADELVDEICKRFNSNPVAREHSLFARPYRRELLQEKYSDFVPDIKIDKPDTIYFSGRVSKFIEINHNLRPLQEDLKGIRYPHTGLKGSDPLFVYSSGLEEHIRDDDPNDLRLAYKMLSRYFGVAFKGV